MQRVILTTNGIAMDEMADLTYDEKTETVTFKHRGRTYRVAVEDSLGSYIKVFEDGEIEILDRTAHCHNS